MGTGILYHVRGGGPIKGSRTLRFRNKFQGHSCLIASPKENLAVRDWFNRHLVCKYPYIRNTIWDKDGKFVGVMLNSVSNNPQWQLDKSSILDTVVHVYTFMIDHRWNKHPFKDCYITRANVKYNRNVTALTLASLLNNENFSIEYTE